MKEAGIARFDVVQQADDPTRFVLVEVYKNRRHLLRTKRRRIMPSGVTAVAEMMAEPRQGIKYGNIFPDDSGGKRTVTTEFEILKETCVLCALLNYAFI
jgi:autoinducer 2-degrading protein